MYTLTKVASRSSSVQVYQSVSR